MTSILKEVQDDVSYLSRVKMFKIIVFASIVGIIIFVIVMLILQYKDTQQTIINKKISSILLQMQDNPSDEQVADLKTMIADQDTALSAFAILEIVGLDLQRKDYKAAVDNLRKIIDSTKSSDVIKSHAVITLIGIAIDHDNIVEQVLLDKCLDYIDNDKIPFNANAKIVKALYLIKQGNKIDAEKLLKVVINTNNVAQIIKTQALATLASITYYDQDK